MSWATFQDVTDRWVGQNEPTDEDQVNALIQDAEAIVLKEFPRIQDRIDAGTLPLAIVTMVVCRMVSRVLRNPENLTYWQQQTGPFGQGRTFGKETDIWLTSDEEELLAPKLRGKAFEINLAPNATNGGDYIYLTGNGYSEGYAPYGSGSSYGNDD
jgi:hypothetical protein